MAEMYEKLKNISNSNVREKGNTEALTQNQTKPETQLDHEIESPLLNTQHVVNVTDQIRKTKPLR